MEGGATNALLRGVLDQMDVIKALYAGQEYPFEVRTIFLATND